MRRERAGAPEPAVVERLRSEAVRLRRERYPGDVVRDIEDRLSQPRRRRVPVVRLAAAAALLVAVGALVYLRKPKDPTPLRAEAAHASPFQTVAGVSSAAPLGLSLSPVPPGLGRADRLGVAALTAVRDPITSHTASADAR